MARSKPYARPYPLAGTTSVCNGLWAGTRVVDGDGSNDVGTS
jgi:hypothetical protein